MKYLKCFKKQVNIVLSLSIFVLGIIAIVLGFTNQLFGCESTAASWQNQLTALNRFDIRTEGTTTFTLQGIIEFSSRLLANSSDEYLNNAVKITPEYINAASALKVLTIILIAFYGIFVIGSLFNFKQYTNLTSCLVSLVLTLVIKKIGFDVFYSTDMNAVMMNVVNNTYTALVVLWSIALFLSSAQYAFNLYVKYSK